MTQILGSRFLVQPFRGFRRLLPVGFAGTVVLLLLTASGALAQSESNSAAIQRSKPTVSATRPATPQDVAPAPAPPPSRPSVEPTRPPAVTWDGKQLTIDAENSTLADILVALKKQTGASIDIPGAAWGERVFVHLGPGPPRDVISDLVYGMPFDYIVETAEDDPDTLRSVVLTAQGQGDPSSDVVVAGATNGVGSAGGGSIPSANAYRAGATDGGSRPEGARMMPGWSSSGKTTFQADAEATLAAKQAAAQDSAADQDSVAAQDPSPAKDSTAAQDSARAQDAPAGTDVAEAAKASTSTSSASDSSDLSGVGSAIQNMNRMFEQRRQIQAQQNQPPPPPSN